MRVVVWKSSTAVFRPNHSAATVRRDHTGGPGPDGLLPGEPREKNHHLDSPQHSSLIWMPGRACSRRPKEVERLMGGHPCCLVVSLLALLYDRDTAKPLGRRTGRTSTEIAGVQLYGSDQLSPSTQHTSAALEGRPLCLPRLLCSRSLYQLIPLYLLESRKSTLRLRRFPQAPLLNWGLGALPTSRRGVSNNCQESRRERRRNRKQAM